MADYVEKRKIVRAVPVGSPVVETRHDSVIHEHEPRGMSGGVIAAIVLSAIAAAVLITMLIINSQQRDREDLLAQERAAAAAQQTPNQQPQQAPVIVMPPSQPATVPVPVPVLTPAPAAAAPATPTNTEIEIDVRGKLLDDADLHSHTISVRVSGGEVTLSGEVPTEQLKLRAERLARRVKGVTHVVNNIGVQS